MSATDGAAGITRRDVLARLGLGAGAVLIAAGCSGPVPATATSAPAPAPAVASASTAQPKRGGSLRYASGGEPTNLEPQRVLAQATDTVWNLYDTLIAYDDQLKPQPMLAEAFEVTPDFTQITFHLRKGVQFHDGRELVSEDVSYSLLRARDPKVGTGQLANQSAWFTDIQTPDKYTVILKAQTPRPAMFDFFEFFNIVDKNHLEGPDPLTKANGTGPFKLADYQPGQQWRFTRNANYWQTGKPYLDEVVLTWSADAQSMVVQLEAGALDIAMTPPLRDFARLQSDRAYQAVSNPIHSQIGLIGINTTVAPFSDKRVRQALQYAINRQRYVDSVLFKSGEARILPWGPLSPAYEPDKTDGYTFDLQQAQSMLAAAGAANLGLEFTYNGAVAEAASLAQIVQSDLASIGVKVTLLPLDTNAQRDYVQNLKYQGLNGSAAATWTNLDGSTLLSQATTYNYTGNFTGFRSDQYSRLVSAAQVEPDLAKRKALYSQINDLLLDESFALVVNSTAPRLLGRSSVSGAAWRVNDGFVLTNVGLAT